ncbi:hypothetical protein H8S77_12170 [Parabacteroides sp. BX2]|jgi:hypothetical protein|uniref:Major fimbrial subunit protein N-terminal domain-containing protein n=1 Tax=Parabacteroides segnis TaxID=2763058 RepID=A0ABR7E2P8_9BACT|nr:MULTISPECIES: hypothetical protein [Parabacteroides]MBC5643641.1 hypothetical protein [Parabacteroides segnis]MCM0713766.1 hypothetical protein [Parabacteroides sp. TA-V-105]
MNAKNIISAILMVLSFAACSSDIEGLDDNMTNTSANNGETSISVRMMTDGIGTKSNGQSELAINNFVIAVFEAASGQRIGYADSNKGVSGGDMTKVTVDNIDTKEGLVNVVVVANAGIDQFKDIYTYEEFGNQIVRDNLNDLVKVGTKTQSLSKDGKNKVEIQLSQLTARVKVDLKYETTGVVADDDVAVSFIATNYSYNAATASTILNPENKTENLVGQDFSKNSVNVSSFYYDTYRMNTPKLSVTTSLSVTVKGTLVKEGETKVTVPFTRGSELLKCLENGKVYTQVITVKINFNISRPTDVTLEYEVATVREIENEITFG